MAAAQICSAVNPVSAGICDAAVRPQISPLPAIRTAFSAGSTVLAIECQACQPLREGKQIRADISPSETGTVGRTSAIWSGAISPQLGSNVRRCGEMPAFDSEIDPYIKSDRTCGGLSSTF